MKALFLEDGRALVKEVKRPVPSPDEALIQVVRAGICNTDIELIKGYMNYSGVLGHEFVGRVLESSNGEWDGMRVVGEINLPCGTCELCLAGMSNHCRSRDVLGISGRNGVFAEFTVLPLASLHHVPDGVSDTQAVFVEPLAAACEILEQVRIENGMSVAVLGDGKLGLLTAQVMRLRTPHVVCFGRVRNKLDRIQKRGIRTALNVSGRSGEFDIVVEATGSPEGIREALELIKPRGTIVLKTTIHGDSPVDLSRVVVDEITLIGSRCGPFEVALKFLEKKQVDVDLFVDREYLLEDAVKALSYAQKPETLKVLLVP